MTEHQARTLFELPTYANRKQGYNRYRYLLKKHHPDKGGSTEMCKEIIAAWDVLKDVLPNDLRIVTLSEVVTADGRRFFNRFCQARIESDGTRFEGTSIYYIRIRSNVYEWNRRSEEFYPRFPDEDKVLHDGRNCKVIIYPQGHSEVEWAEWAVPWK